MGANRKSLIEFLHDQELFEARFRRPRVCNCDPKTGDAFNDGGCFSVVFRAMDDHTGLPVAIKFFDPDRQGIANDIRRAQFLREAALLQRLSGIDRCLQPVTGANEIDLQIIDPTDGTVRGSVACQYFVTEWLDQDICDYFFNHETYTALEKLVLYREIVLATFALHRNGLVHRDLKYDNLRVAHRATKNVIVAIDYGTAVALDSDPIGTKQDYATPIGATAFAPLEAHLGLAPIRRLGIAADTFAIGAILNDLFSSELYMARLADDPGFQKVYMQGQQLVMRMRHDNATYDRIAASVEKFIGSSKRSVTLPPICDEHEASHVPSRARAPLTDILHGLTAVDYRDRWRKRGYIIRRIDSAIRLLKAAE